MNPLEQPIQHKKEFFFAWQEWLKGSSLSDISNFLNLQPDFNDIPVETLEIWKDCFENISTLDQEEDRIFRWDKMDQYGIPWRDANFLLSISQAYENPTGRLMKWIWRLSKIKDIGRWDIESLLGLAEQYTNLEREIMFMQPVTDSIDDLYEEVRREALDDDTV